MNLAHLHLLLNHFPVIGTMIATGLFITSFVGENRDLRRAGLVIFVAMAAISIPTFVSGVGAMMIVRAQPDVTQELIRRHEGSAMIAFAFMELTGAVAVIALWPRRRSEMKADPATLALVLFSLVTVALMARTGNTGGEIRHSEIVSPQSGTEQKMEVMARMLEPDPGKVSDAVLSNKWWWALLMDLHLIGVSLIIGAVGLLNLRILGLVKQLPTAPLHAAMPWAFGGVGINILTGMTAFVAQPGSYVLNAAFWLKIAVLMLLGSNLALFYLTGILDRLRQMPSGSEAPFSAKVLAASSLLFWLLVIALGRYLHLYANSLPLN